MKKILLTSILLSSLATLNARTFRVDSSANGIETGLSWADAFLNLQDALATAVSGDKIWIAKGTYYPDEGGSSINNDRVATFNLIDGVEIFGGFIGNEIFVTQADPAQNTTILSGDIMQNDDPNDETSNGDNSLHIITGANLSDSTTLSGLTITAGNTSFDFAGFYSDKGAGILLTNNSNPLIEGCDFTYNSAAHGGAIYNDYSSPTIQNCSFQSNNASFSSGAINNNNSSPQVTNCKFQGNFSEGIAGAIYNNESSPTYTNCLFTGNRSYSGGAAYDREGSPTYINCTFQGNTAEDRGGAIFNLNSPHELISCIIWNNANQGNDTSTIESSIKNANNGTYSYSLIQHINPAGSTNLNGMIPANNPLFVMEVDPLSAPSTTGDLRLLLGSPALNIGSITENTSTTDLAGHARTTNNTIEISDNPHLNPTFNDIGITFSYRKNATDFSMAFENSKSLSQNSWTEFTINLNTPGNTETSLGSKALITLNPLFDQKAFFYRQKITR